MNKILFNEISKIELDINFQTTRYFKVLPLGLKWFNFLKNNSELLWNS